MGRPDRHAGGRPRSRVGAFTSETADPGTRSRRSTSGTLEVAQQIPDRSLALVAVAQSRAGRAGRGGQGGPDGTPPQPCSRLHQRNGVSGLAATEFGGRHIDVAQQIPDRAVTLVAVAQERAGEAGRAGSNLAAPVRVGRPRPRSRRVVSARGPSPPAAFAVDADGSKPPPARRGGRPHPRRRRRASRRENAALADQAGSDGPPAIALGLARLGECASECAHDHLTRRLRFLRAVTDQDRRSAHALPRPSVRSPTRTVGTTSRRSAP